MLLFERRGDHKYSTPLHSTPFNSTHLDYIDVAKVGGRVQGGVLHLVVDSVAVLVVVEARLNLPQPSRPGCGHEKVRALLPRQVVEDDHCDERSESRRERGVYGLERATELAAQRYCVRKSPGD